MAKVDNPIGGCLKIVKYSFVMQKITQCLQLPHVPSFQISCESNLRRKSYEPKTTRSRTRGQKIGQVFLATT